MADANDSTFHLAAGRRYKGRPRGLGADTRNDLPSEAAYIPQYRRTSRLYSALANTACPIAPPARNDRGNLGARRDLRRGEICRMAPLGVDIYDE